MNASCRVGKVFEVRGDCRHAPIPVWGTIPGVGGGVGG